VSDVLIRDVPQAVLESLKQRAASHRRSLQQELLSILEVAAGSPGEPDPVKIAATIRDRLTRSGRVFSDSAPIIREDRER
jgi:antitoxin FitA